MMIFYCVEDELSRAVAERLILDCCPADACMKELGRTYGGFGHIKNNLRKYQDLAMTSPVLVLTDLDNAECAPSLRANWLAAANIREPLPDKMLFCIARTEIESWLLADRDGIARFLSISPAKIANDVENTVTDTKEYLVNLAKGSKSRDIRKDLTPESKSDAPTGLSYNYRLCQFVRDSWDHKAAANNSITLNRTIKKLSALPL